MFSNACTSCILKSYLYSSSGSELCSLVLLDLRIPECVDLDGHLYRSPLYSFLLLFKMIEGGTQCWVAGAKAKEQCG